MSAGSGKTSRSRALLTAALARRKEQRSLFGEILDWMLAPLLLMWPMSLAPAATLRFITSVEMA